MVFLATFISRVFGAELYPYHRSTGLRATRPICQFPILLLLRYEFLPTERPSGSLNSGHHHSRHESTIVCLIEMIREFADAMFLTPERLSFRTAHDFAGTFQMLNYSPLFFPSTRARLQDLQTSIAC